MREWVAGKTQHEYCRERVYPAAGAGRCQAALKQCGVGCASGSEERCSVPSDSDSDILQALAPVSMATCRRLLALKQAW